MEDDSFVGPCDRGSTVLLAPSAQAFNHERQQIRVYRSARSPTAFVDAADVVSQGLNFDQWEAFVNEFSPMVRVGLTSLPKSRPPSGKRASDLRPRPVILSSMGTSYCKMA